MSNPEGIDQLSDLGKQLFYNKPACTSYFDVRDCSVITKDGKRFHISKQILDFYPVFSKLISVNEAEHGVQEHFLMKSILEYRLACEWNLDKVKRKVMEEMTKNISIEDSISVHKTCVMFAPNYKAQTFEHLTYVITRAVLDDKNTGFQELTADEVKEILSADLLNVENELDIWKMIKAWLMHDKKNRFNALPELLSCIRWEFLSDAEKTILENEFSEFKIHGISSIVSKTKEHRIPRDFLVAIGGWKNDGPTDIVELMDTNQDCWRRMRYMEGKRKIAYHGCVIIGETIYVLGGYEGTAYFNKMFSLNIKSGLWKECAPMQYNRCYVAACEYQGKVFAAGGADNLNLPRLKTAEMYDTETNQWVRISDMTRSRSDAAACVMRGKVYVVGGFDGFRVLQTVDVYDPETNIWVEFAHLQSPRSGLACAVDDDCILIFGGYDGAICASSGELLRLGSAHTTELPPLPAPRANFDVCKLGKYFYAVGGWDRDGLYKDTVFRFDRQHWEKINGLRVARCSAKLVVLKAYPNPLSVLDL